MGDSRWAEFCEQMRAYLVPGREGPFTRSLEGQSRGRPFDYDRFPVGTLRLGGEYTHEGRLYFFDTGPGGVGTPQAWGFLRTDYPTDGAAQIVETYRGGFAPRLTAARPLSIGLRRSVTTQYISQQHLLTDQTVGAEVFDAQVYVQAVADDATLAQVLASEGARQAVLTLLGLGCALLVIDDEQGFVTARLEGDAMPEQTDRLAARVLAAMHRLVRALPGFGSAR